MAAIKQRLSYSVREYAALTGKTVRQVQHMIRTGQFGDPAELPRVGVGPKAAYEIPAWRVENRLGTPGEKAAS